MRTAFVSSALDATEMIHKHQHFTRCCALPLLLQHLDATEMTLSNGMRVLMKHTTHMEDELYLTGVAAGGLTEVCLKKY